MRRRGPSFGKTNVNKEEMWFDQLRNSLDSEDRVAGTTKAETISGLENCSGIGVEDGGGDGHVDYWTAERAASAERYIRDVVYGGVDGLAYVRSLAEFVRRDSEDPMVS